MPENTIGENFVNKISHNAYENRIMKIGDNESEVCLRFFLLKGEKQDRNYEKQSAPGWNESCPQPYGEKVVGHKVKTGIKADNEKA